jgi:phosphoribosylaminoimidazolecarboxamide formyltransferase/IMP cyclohydrolase
MTDLVPVKRALISLSDKNGLGELAAGLARHGVEIVSTGGTAAKLRESGAAVKDRCRAKFRTCWSWGFGRPRRTER